ncbi:hypothetical protein VNI00_016775 [Paramarasmius palmivorus]|uniref:F-box domain-containing protein n=1 Tax=Paramarasmius palmivorus TaxID=297713 RepID=A0AAW0BBS5_9AGAR
MHVILSTNFMVHLVETLPPLPCVSVGNWKLQKAVIESELSRTFTAATWLHDAHIFGDMTDSQYTRLRNTLHRYRQNLRWLTSPFHRCPTELLVRILKYATPVVEIDASFVQPNPPLPLLYCPQISVLSVLSRKFHALVKQHPELLSNIRLRRRINCPHHPATIPRDISNLLALTGAWPLDILVEVPDPGNYSPPIPLAVSLSICPLMEQLRTRPWRSFAFIGPSYVAAPLFLARDQFPMVAPRITSVHLSRVTTIAKFLEMASSSAIPLYSLSISAVDAWELPNFNDPPHQLPLTVQHLRIRGSSRTVLLVLQTAVHVPSITVSLVSGVDSRTGNWQIAGNAPATHVLQARIALPNLTSFHFADEDYWGHVGPDLFNWFDAPALTEFTFDWTKSTTYFSIDYHNSLVQFHTRNPQIHTVYMFNLPPETEALSVILPHCNFRRFTDRLPPLEHIDWRHQTYRMDSDSEEDSDSDTLSVASNGIVNECTCLLRYNYCDCHNEVYRRLPRIRQDITWSDEVYF